MPFSTSEITINDTDDNDGLPTPVVTPVPDVTGIKLTSEKSPDAAQAKKNRKGLSDNLS